MSANFNEVVLHVDETLDDLTLCRLEDDMRSDAGIVSVGHRSDKPHMIMVVYDSEHTRACHLLHNFHDCGLHAQVIGL